MTTTLPGSKCLAAAIMGGSLLLAGCGQESHTANGSGELTLGVTDAPIDQAESLTIEFTGITVKPAEGEPIRIDLPDDNGDGEADPETITLTDLTGGQRIVLLDSATVPAGDYAWIRLNVNAEHDGIEDSIITLEDGSKPELRIPSGPQTGLKLVGGVTVPEGDAADVTIDFDLRKSVHETGNGKFIMRPTLRLVNTGSTGTLAGSIGDQFLTNQSCDPAVDGAAVYVYEGEVAPDDYTEEALDSGDIDPLTSSRPEQLEGSETWRYEVGFLEAGTYTVSFTCEADLDLGGENDYDEEATDNEMTFSGTAVEEITAGDTTTYDFTASSTQ